MKYRYGKVQVDSKVKSGQNQAKVPNLENQPLQIHKIEHLLKTSHFFVPPKTLVFSKYQAF